MSLLLSKTLNLVALNTLIHRQRGFGNNTDTRNKCFIVLDISKANKEGPIKNRWSLFILGNNVQCEKE